jgi:hypothetical protein
MATIDLTDPNAQVDQIQLDRRMRLAEQLRQQAMAPDQQQMAGGYVLPINPFQGAAKMLQAYSASKIDEETDAQRKGMQQQKMQKIAEALKGYGKVNEVSTELGDMSNRDPSQGIYNYKQTSRAATPDEQMQQDWQLSQLDPAFAKVLEARHTREDTQQARMDQLRLQQELRQDQMRNAAQPYFQPLQTSQGVYSFNARTGQVEPVQGGQGGGQPLVGAQFDPKLQGLISGAKAGATTTADATAKRDIKMAGLGSTIDRAREILKSGPTASLIGAGRDVAAGALGISTQGAEKADALAAIGGSLVSKMPRMEGPQSNIDVENYRIMAGRVGDRALPVERRMAALDEVEKLYRKYDKQSPNIPAPSGGAKFLGFE